MESRCRVLLEQRFFLFLAFLWLTLIGELSGAPDRRSVIPRFPQIQFTYMQDVIIMSKERGTALSVSRDQHGHRQLVLKTLASETSTDNNDTLFKIYYYTKSEVGETKLMLPQHIKTGSFLSMTQDHQLMLQDEDEIHNNDIDSPAITALKRADSRFFYIKDSGPGETSSVFEAMNGVDYNYVLCVNGENSLELCHVQPGPGPEYPRNTLFEIFDPHGSDTK